MNYLRLRSNRFLLHSLILAGNLLLMVEYWARGLVYNSTENLFSSLVTVLIFTQMHRTTLLPWQFRPRSQPTPTDAARKH